MANKNMVFGSNEATTLNSPISIAGTNLKFGVGQYDESKVIGIATAETADAKVRFVYDGPGNSGLIFVGNKLVSSKILDVTPVTEPRQVYDSSSGELIDSDTEVCVTKLKIKWFGTAVDPADNTSKTKYWETEVDIIDRDSVAEMIMLLDQRLTAKLKELEYDTTLEHIEEIDSSIAGIEDFLKTEVVTPNSSTGALSVKTTTDENGYNSYEIGVNVDGSSVKTVDNKLAVATYSIDKLDEGEDGYSSEWSAQYRMLMKDPATGKETQVGDTINIMKDFLVRDAHVCTFKYADNKGNELDYTETPKDNDVTADKLPWALLSTGVWEQAITAHNIKYGHTYLHLILNTKPTDEIESGNDLTTDVYLDFTEIFTSFTGDGEFINIDDSGIISLNIEAVKEAIDASLGLSEFKQETEDHFDVLDDAVDTLNSSVNLIESSYLTSVELEAPKSTNSLFNELTITQKKNGVESQTSVDIANDKFYDALNDALETLQSNDTYLSNLLTWEDL